VASESILQAIGSTPLVRLKHVAGADAADVVVKLEYYNPTGSYKDRMALAMIEGAEARGALKPGMRVVEFTGGSTGSSLALVCAVKGYRFVPVSSDAFAKEKLDTMRAFGADLQVVDSDGGSITPDLFVRMRAAVDRLCEEPGTYWTDQFHNADAITGYMGIGRELVEQTGGTLHAFCGAVGTGGMLTGVSKALRAAGCAATIVALEPASAPVLTAGKSGSHRVEGIAPGFVRRTLLPGLRRGACRAGRGSTRDGSPSRAGRRHIRRHVVRPQRRGSNPTGARMDRGKWSRRLRSIAG
jgi:cysteine synthase A